MLIVIFSDGEYNFKNTLFVVIISHFIHSTDFFFPAQLVYFSESFLFLLMFTLDFKYKKLI